MFSWMRMITALLLISLASTQSTSHLLHVLNSVTPAAAPLPLEGSPVYFRTWSSPGLQVLRGGLRKESRQVSEAIDQEPTVGAPASGEKAAGKREGEDQLPAPLQRKKLRASKQAPRSTSAKLVQRNASSTEEADQGKAEDAEEGEKLLLQRRMAEELLKAASDGNVTKVQQLISLGANTTITDKRSKTPLHLAAANGHPAAVAALLAAGASRHAIDEEGRTPLVSALWSGGELDDAGRPTADRGHAVVVELLAVDGHVNLRNRRGRTPLQVAVWEGSHPASVKKLLAAGANTEVTAELGKTPLHIAVDFRRSKILEKLLAGGANTDAFDQWGYTPLHLAAAKGHAEQVEMLVKAGANVNTKKQGGKTPLRSAIGKGGLDGYPVIVKALLAAGANMDPATKVAVDKFLGLASRRDAKKKVAWSVVRGAEHAELMWKLTVRDV
mmetsp:Transcript_23448/g.55831  ORF Transcript_23448/g.55831 Transcript_23448/m.55831 type:complete len:442 (+) Transcript_23448:16-1341(+)